ncbi:Cbr3 [Symbiodinium sp. CCMP2456]|nr:Cbr3 [Symbiodinium sp. CCMP2456]
MPKAHTRNPRSLEWQELGCDFVHLDVSDGSSVSSLPDRLKTLGVSKLSLLVNNAGVMYDGWSRENWENHWTTNVVGQVELVNKLKSHLDTRASIVNVSSGWGCKSELSNPAIADKACRTCITYATNYRTTTLNPKPETPPSALTILSEA